MTSKITLIQATKAKLAECPNIGPASAAPIALLVKASKFQRGAVAALSIKAQKADLAEAKRLLAKGLPELASLYITSFKAERKNYELLFTLGL